MFDYEYLFCTSLTRELREHIKGKIFCKIVGDSLHISIKTDEIGEWSCTYTTNFSENLVYGRITIDGVTNIVVREYKRFIMSRFLK